MNSPQEWMLEVSEDFEVPGWLFVPTALDQAGQEQWLADAAAALSFMVGVERWDGVPTSEDDVRQVLQSTLELRAESDCLAMFQVFPVNGPVPVTCTVNIYDSATMPDWFDTGAVVHPADSPHLGPGLQCSTKETLTVGDEQADLFSVHFVFDNGDATVLLSLDQSTGPLITRTLPGFVLLKDVLRVVDRATGQPFAAVAPTGFLDDGPWVEEEATR